MNSSFEAHQFIGSALVNSVPDASFLADHTGRIVAANGIAEKLFGYARGELEGIDASALIPPRLRAMHERVHAEYFARPVHRAMGLGLDLRAVRKDGVEFAVDITLSPLRLGQANFVVVTVRGLDDVEERYRAMFELLSVGVVYTDAQGALLNVNDRFCELFGYTKDEARKLNIRDITHPDDIGASVAVRERMLAGRQDHYEKELRLVTKDGRLVWTRVTTSVVRRGDAVAQHFVTLLQDISQQRRAEAAHRESERRFRELLGGIDLIACMLDNDARVTYCNDYLLRLTGWSREEIIGRDWFELFVAREHREQQQVLFRKLLAGDPDAWHHENENITRSGERRLIRWNNIVLRTPVGEVIGAASIAEDVTERRAAEAVHARLAAIVESSDDAIIGKTLDSIITTWNRGAEKLLGYRADEMVGQSITLILPDDRLDEEQDILVQLARGEQVKDIETVRKHKNGGLIDVSITVSPIRDAQGRVIGASKIARDITARKRADTKMRRLNRVYAVLSSINGLLVRVNDRNELYREACRIAVDAGHFKLAWMALLDRADRRPHLVAWHGAGDGYVEHLPRQWGEPHASGESLSVAAVSTRTAMISNDIASDPRVRLPEECGKRGFRSVAALPLLIAGEPVGVLTLYAGEVGFFDEEEIKLLEELAGDVAFAMDHLDKEEKINYLAYYDQLTGFATRTLFLERLEQRLAALRGTGAGLSLAVLDVERLTVLNNSLGWRVGDHILTQVGKRLAHFSYDSALARIGGDVFAVVLPVAEGKADVTATLKRMWRKVFQDPCIVDGIEFPVTARGGVALFPADATGAEALLRSAEVTLQHAKKTTESFLFHSPEMSEATTQSMTLESQLRRALDQQQLVLHYQPKVDAETGRIVGVEALMRWQSPELGLVPPGKFIPLMEETGLIVQAGTWALSRAAADQARWAAQGLPPLPTSVNVSALQMRKENFVTAFTGAAGRAAPLLEIEITESLLMDDVEDKIRKLNEVRKLGFKVAIDDFGTGYSSLGYLARLPVDMLKVDRSFVIAMLEDPDSLTLVQTIISLAHSLRLKVVAEGVETEEQARILRLLRCDEMQGFLFSRPLPFEEVTVLLQKDGMD